MGNGYGNSKQSVAYRWEGSVWTRVVSSQKSMQSTIRICCLLKWLDDNSMGEDACFKARELEINAQMIKKRELISTRLSRIYIFMTLFVDTKI